MRNRLLLITMASAIAGTAAAQNYSVNLANGKLPSDITVMDRDGQTVPSTCYKNGRTTSGWTVGAVGNAYAAISPSHSHDGSAQDNILSLPPLTIEPGAIIRWKARSVYPDFPDTYRVEITPKGDSQPTVLYKGAAEEVFTFHTADLSKYAGKEVTLSFVCTSENGYLLAISDIFAGVPETPEIVLTDLTKKYYGPDESAAAICRAANYGATVTLDRIETTGANGTVRKYPVDLTLKPGDSIELGVTFPLAFNEPTAYKYTLFDKSGNQLASISGTAMASHYQRQLFLDEGTGTWCNNCPKGVVEIRSLRRQFGNQISVVSTHPQMSNDVFANPEYWSGLGFYAVPYFMLNRNTDTKRGDTTSLSKGYYEPTTVEIALNSSASGVDISVTSAEDLDNSADRYRLAYVQTVAFHTDELVPEYYQDNALTSTSAEEYYYLPSKIISHLAKFHDITIGGEAPFEGIAKSIPADLKAGETATYRIFPEGIDDPETGYYDSKVIVYLLDTDTGRIMNCAEVPLDNNSHDVISGVEQTAVASPRIRISGGLLSIEGADEAEVTIYRTEGARIASLKWNGGTLALPDAAGSPVIIHAVTPQGIATAKAVI